MLKITISQNGDNRKYLDVWFFVFWQKDLFSLAYVHKKSRKYAAFFVDEFFIIRIRSGF